MDILATAAHLAGTPVLGNIDGVNLIPYLDGSESGVPHDTFFWRQGHKRALRQGDWKLVSMKKKSWELYNLATDLGESNDQSGTHPEVLGKLIAVWEQYNQTMQEPLFR